MSKCPCNPEKDFDLCCGPFLAGEDAAPTAETLMRSRYVAYTLKDFDYLIRTCHESNRPQKEDFEDEQEINWTGLEILSTEAGGKNDHQGMVEFRASFKVSENTLGHHEKSNFVREDGEWFFLDGETVRPQQAHSVKVGRNTPCPCGSGKKYKKCCLGK